MRFFSPLLILAALLAAACGGAAVLPDEFTRERADGKIPVSIPLIRQQTQKEIDGMPEGQAKAERWQQIEKDHNQCRLLSARSSRAEANEVFAACMSKRDYLYMFRLDAEHLHNDIAAAETVNYVAEKKAIENARLTAEKKAEEERQRKENAAAVERQREKERLAAERKREEEARREAAHRREQERLATEHRRKQQEAERKRQEERRLAINRKLFSAQLINVAKNGNLSEARRLIAAGANPNAAKDDGVTALMWAAQEGHPEIVKMLLDAGANPNTAENNGWTALIAAVRTSLPEIVKMLLDAGANPDAARNDGTTALGSAVFWGNPKIVKILLSAGANPNTTDKSGITALEVAVFNGHLEVVKMLLDAGANPNAAKDDGTTVFMAVATFYGAEIAKMFLDAGANPNAVKDDGTTALMHMVSWGRLEIVNMLLSAGANPNAVGIDGKTALDIAKEAGNDEITKAIHAAMLNLQAADLPETVSPAAQVFENAWRHIVVVKRGENQGSGVIVRPNVVATNCHVIDSSGGITSLFSDDDEIIVHKHDNHRASTDTLFNATIRKRDDDRDFCLLDVKGLQGTSAKLRQYDTLQIGEAVYAVGSPKGLDLSLSSGLISQLRQGGGFRVIQTDAAISPGSSGGGLFDSNGNLIGILTSKITDENVEGIGFAIPADLADNL